MSQPAIVLHPRHPRGVDRALSALDVEVIIPAAPDVPAAVAAHGILVSFVWDDAYLDGLRWVQSVSAGHDQFPVAVFRDRDIVLTSASGVHGPQVSEHAFALLLALTRGVGVAMRRAEHRVWKPMMLDELTGRTVGVLGLGAIGEDIARKATAWGLRVIGTKRDPEGYTGIAEEVFPPEQTEEVFVRSDIVISVLPGGDATDGLVTPRMLAALDGWFVNMGRGNVVAEADLLAALEAGSVLGVGLDVFESEPLPESSPLWSHPRVVLTPHTAGFSPEYGPRLAEIVRDNLAAFAGRGEWRNRVV